MCFAYMTVFLSATLALCTPTPVFAEQTMTVTLSTRVVPQYLSGNLIGCQLGFEVVRHDPEYSKGSLVYLTGNVGFKAFKGKDLAFTLKLGAKKLGSDTFLPPADAYLVNGYATNAQDLISSPLGEEGFRLFVFKAGDVSAKAALDAPLSEGHKITLAYAMSSGGLNAVVPIDLMVVRANLDKPDASEINSTTVDEWGRCLQSVLGAAKQRLEQEVRVGKPHPITAATK